jgi:hypothetical protein
MGKKYQIEVEVPHGLRAGDRFVIDIEQPLEPKVKKTRLSNIPLSQLTHEQLKRELINARSVLYKAQARGDEKKLIEATKRVNRVAEELAKRNGTTLFEEINAPIGLFDEDDTSKRLH